MNEGDDTPMEGVLYIRMGAAISRVNVSVVAADGWVGDDAPYPQWRIVAVTTGDVHHVRTATQDTR